MLYNHKKIRQFLFEAKIFAARKNFFLFSCVFILPSQESDQSAIRVRFKKNFFAARKFFFFLFSCVFIFLSRESDQCAIRARLGVASHLSTTPRWRNPAKRLSQRHK